MIPPSNVNLNAFLASVPDDFNFGNTSEQFLEKQCLDLFTAAGVDPREVLLIPYAEDEFGCLPYITASAQSILDNRQILCISKGNEVEMIMNAEAVIVTGGDIQKLKKAATGFGQALWEKVLGGMPFIGINAGGEFLSSVYMSGIDQSSYNLVSFPLQFFHHFNGNNAADYKRVTESFNNPGYGLKYIVGLPDGQIEKEGSGIVMENSKAGLAGGNKINQGDDPPLGSSIFLYKKEPDGSIAQLDPKESEKKTTPYQSS